MTNLGLCFNTRYQRESQNQTGICVVEEHNGTDVNTALCRRESQIKDGRQKPKVEMKQHNISASIQDSSENPKATPTFLGSCNSVGLV